MPAKVRLWCTTYFTPSLKKCSFWPGVPQCVPLFLRLLSCSTWSRCVMEPLRLHFPTGKVHIKLNFMTFRHFSTLLGVTCPRLCYSLWIFLENWETKCTHYQFILVLRKSGIEIVFFLFITGFQNGEMELLNRVCLLTFLPSTCYIRWTAKWRSMAGFQSDLEHWRSRWTILFSSPLPSVGQKA